MSELLTTGEMIDKIKAGESAECVDNPNEMDCPAKGQTVLFDGASIFWNDQFRNRFIINDFTMPLKWRILPKPIQYVTFEEATSALKEKKCRYAKLFTDTGYIVFEDYTTKPYDLSLKQLFEGKWQIIE